jgi:hypothetical protein
MNDKEYIKKLEEALYESFMLNLSFICGTSPRDKDRFYSEYRYVVKQATEALKLSKNRKMKDAHMDGRMPDL